MQTELILTFLLLFALSLLATVDMAFGQLSDVGLRRLISEAEERAKLRSSAFLKQVLENRPRFSFAISATIQILLVAVAVLITSISLAWFQEDRFVLVGLLAGLILAGIFRQLIHCLFRLAIPRHAAVSAAGDSSLVAVNGVRRRPLSQAD